MGYYINPTDGRSKESWLIEEGRQIPYSKVLDLFDEETFEASDGMVPVCLVDNGGFTAAGIAYDVQEAKAFMQPTDDRPKVWYAVSREKLRDFCNRL